MLGDVREREVKHMGCTGNDRRPQALLLQPRPHALHLWLGVGDEDRDVAAAQLIDLLGKKFERMDVCVMLLPPQLSVNVE